MALHSLFNRNLGVKTAVQLKEIFNRIDSTITGLNLGRNEFYRLSGAELAKAFAAIPETVTTLNLSDNNLSELTNAELIQILTAIPASVTKVVLRGNDLFKNKSPGEIDKLLNLLKPLEKEGRLDLSDNGEPTGARVAAPLIDMVLAERIPTEIAATVMAYADNKYDEKSMLRYNNKLKPVIEEQDARRGFPVWRCLQNIIFIMGHKDPQISLRIQEAIEPLLHLESDKTESSLIAAVKDSGSDLYKALNTHRNPIPLAFFGKKHIISMETRSLQKVKAVIEKHLETTQSALAPTL